MNKKTIFRTVNLAISLALIVFSFIYFRHLVDQVQLSDIDFKLLPFVLAIALFVINYLFFSFNWLQSARMIDGQAKFKQLAVFCASQPYKYLPTSLFVLSYRSVFAHKLGMTIKKASIAQLPENISIFAANFALFAVFIAFYTHLLLGGVVLLGWLTVLLWLRTRKTIVIKLPKNKHTSVSGETLSNMLTLTSLGWFSIGLSFLAFAWSLGLDVNVIEFLAANTIAFSLGMLTVFAPGGIGVREAIYNLFAIPHVLIIFWRIFVFVMDIVLGLGAILYIYTKGTKAQ